MKANPVPLFEIQFKVYLKSEHPEFGKFHSGRLFLWLYAADAPQAYNFAEAIAGFLPFAIDGGKSFPVDGQNNLARWEIDKAAIAGEIGMNIGFQGFVDAADELDHLGAMWPNLVPMSTPSWTPLHIQS